MLTGIGGRRQKQCESLGHVSFLLPDARKRRRRRAAEASMEEEKPGAADEDQGNAED
jgi:hypothetical protein